MDKNNKYRKIRSEIKNICESAKIVPENNIFADNCGIDDTNCVLPTVFISDKFK